MANTDVKEVIANLSIGTPEEAIRASGFGLAPGAPDAAIITAVDIDKLPDGLVTGSNLVQFPPEATAEIRSSVALSLLAAQRVASKDSSVLTPKDWFDRHNTVLSQLNWLGDGGGVLESTFNNLNVAVHKAIIPFLAAAFGGAVAAGALILTALNQLQDMDKDSPWITLFDNQSRHFDVTEYQFSVVEIVGDQVKLHLASARFDAKFGQTQVLFFKVNHGTATFESASGSFTQAASLLTEMNGDLKAKLASFTKSFIQSLPDDLG
jgi:hypothetical protein